jgi:hypothetical protein
MIQLSHRSPGDPGRVESPSRGHKLEAPSQATGPTASNRIAVSLAAAGYDLIITGTLSQYYGPGPSLPAGPARRRRRAAAQPECHGSTGITGSACRPGPGLS